MLNIDKLRYNWEKPFLELMEGMKRKVHPDEPHKTLWYKEDGWYFEQDEKTGRLWCQINRVWSFFETNYSPKYSDIQLIIKNLMERHYKLKGLTPLKSILFLLLKMERHYKLKGLTPTVTQIWGSNRWKDITN